jgi:serine/threonine-protein kinase
MSPEQLNGDPVDGRSDLFSLGAVLYTMLTGYRPFQGNSALTVSFKVVNREPVPVSALDSEVAPEIDYIISRAMAKETPQRYQTGMEMALDLQDVRQGFLPRSTMSTRLPDTNPDQGALQTGGLSTIRLSLPAAATLVNGKRSAGESRKVTAWPLWQYLAILVMAIGVLGIGFAMFRRPISGEAVDWIAGPTNPVSTPTVANKPADAPAAIPTVTAADNISTEPDGDPGILKETPKIPPPVPKKPASRAANVKTSETGPVERAAAKPEGVSSQTIVGFSTLHMRVEHHFPQAEIFMWIDDKLTYTHTLDGTVKKRLVVFKGVQGFESESFRVSAGEHTVRVRVQSSTKSYDRTANITGDFPIDGERALRIDCQKRELKLALQ